MMLPINDSFIGLDHVRVPKRGSAAVYLSPGYDSGSEINDEICLNIPGPFGREGYVHISRGNSGQVGLSVAQ